MATDTITVDCLAYLGTQLHDRHNIWASEAYEAHIMRQQTGTHAGMRASQGGRAGAMPGVAVRIYTEIHRLGKLTVNHKNN